MIVNTNHLKDNKNPFHSLQKRDESFSSQLFNFNNTQRSSLLETMEDLEKQNIQKQIGAIVSRLRSGKKLSHAEMGFLRKHAPEIYDEAVMVLRAREQMEQQMKQAKTKQQVQTIGMSMTMAGISGIRSDSGKSSSTSEFYATLANHYTDAYKEYLGTDEYKKKKDLYEDERNRKRDRFVRW